jgi:putative sigma-54 modulation protein
MVQEKVVILIRSFISLHFLNQLIMNIIIQTVHFDADEKLLDFVEKKIQKLTTFHDRITKVDVFLKLDNLVHAIKDKVVEINIHIPKQNCFVKASSKSFEESFEHAYESVINQLKKKKDKLAA